MKRKHFATPYIIWMILFTVVPLLLILFYAFIKQSPGGSLQFTTEFLAKAFSRANMSVLLLSLQYAVITTAICLLLAYPAAMFLAQMKSRFGSIVSLLFMLPMWMNFLLRTYAWQGLLDHNGPINKILGLFGIPAQQLLYTEGAVIFGLVYNFLPFMLLPIYTSFTKLDQSLVHAAEDLGANGWYTFRRVKLPLTAPGIITGVTMVFMPVVTTFIISRLLGGSHYMMFGDLLENQFMLIKDWNTGSALAVIMMVLLVISMAIMRKYTDSEDDRYGKIL